jgi:predicted nucleotidyltransferase
LCGVSGRRGLLGRRLTAFFGISLAPAPFWRGSGEDVMTYALDQPRDIISPFAAKRETETVCVFGSRARGEATEESDVDLLVGGDNSPARGSMRGFANMSDDVEAALGKKADVIADETIGENSGLYMICKRVSKNIRRGKVLIYGAERPSKT